MTSLLLLQQLLLLHNNARPYTTTISLEKLTQQHLATIEHLPYNPDLSPCDCHLFGPLKEVLGGQQFSDNTEAEEFMCNWLQTCSTTFYETIIKETANPMAEVH